jgi:RNA polymerase sigma-70 factor, ECF subfamily
MTTADEFEALLAPHLDKAFGTALHLTRKQDAAEDLIQDAAVQAFRAFATFQEGTNFKAWFFRILINQFRQDYRKSKREPQAAPLDDAPDLYLYAKATQAGLAGDTTDPARRVMEQLDQEQVQEALAMLPEEYRVVNTLYFMEELSYPEIADIVGCIAKVKSVERITVSVKSVAIQTE